jgi:hypothetical protein
MRVDEKREEQETKKEQVQARIAVITGYLPERNSEISKQIGVAQLLDVKCNSD